MQKKFTVLIAVCLFLICGCFLVGCNNDQKDNNQKDKDEYVELTDQNYTYYLSIDNVCTNYATAANGSFRIWSYEYTTSGAVNGLYVDCIIYYQLGDGEEKELPLNAAGYAKLKYQISTNSPGPFKVTKVEGKIYL